MTFQNFVKKHRKKIPQKNVIILYTLLVYVNPKHIKNVSNMLIE